MFDKELMLSSKSSQAYIKSTALKKLQEDMIYIPDNVERMVTYIASQIGTLNTIIRRYEEENIDVTFLVFSRDYALFALGLGDMPKSKSLLESSN
jgi:hypothetical protein